MTFAEKHIHPSSTPVEETRAPKRARFSSNIVTVTAGSGEAPRTFSIHEDIVNNSSDFFHAALEKNWRERRTRQIDLLDDSSDVVSTYIDWCYTKEIATKKLVASKKITVAEDGDFDVDEEFDFLAKLYVFGDKNRDKAFCKAVTSTMIQLTKGYRTKVDENLLRRAYPGPSTISIIYENTPPDCIARHVIVDVYAADASREWLKDDAILKIPEFLRDLAVAQIQETVQVPKAAQPAEIEVARGSEITQTSVSGKRTRSGRIRLT